MNRRDFFKTAAAGVPLAGAAGQAAPQAPKLKISIMAYSFHGLLAEGRMDLFGYLEACKYRHGLDAADIWNSFLKSTEPDYLKMVRRELDEREMELADLCVDRAHVWEDDPAGREQNYRNALAHLKAAVILSARFVRIDAGGKGDTWTPEQFDHIVKRYREYAQFAHDNGFRMGAESHWGPETVWPNMKRLYQAVDHPGFGISCHIGGFVGSEQDKVRAEREAAPWVWHTHIDWSICEGALDERLRTFWNAGYQGYYSVEHHSAKQEYVNVAIQLAKVRATLDRLRAGT